MTDRIREILNVRGFVEEPFAEAPMPNEEEM